MNDREWDIKPLFPGDYMPNTTGSKGPSRWEGTHTYPKGGTQRKRTLAQVQEEAAARIKADREKRRIGVEKLRRNSIAAFPTAANTISSDPEEEFFDADDAGGMTGSNKKKRQSGANQDKAGARDNDKDEEPEVMEVDQRPRGVDPEMKALLLSIKSDINASTNAAVERIDKKIQDNEAAIKKVGEDNANELRKLQKHVDESQSRLEERIDKKLQERDGIVDRRLMELENRGKINTGAKSPGMRGHRREDAYHKCRRTLKIWPVNGEDLVDQARVFMRQSLKISDSRIQSIGNIIVTPAAGRLAKERGEVLVLFEEKEDRDYVKSTGINLAGNRQAGMTLHVPGHLLDDYFALNSVGYNIKTSHEGVKRSVKFDDSTMGLFLDICIANKWRRIYPDQAREALKSAPPEASSSGNRAISTTDLTSLMQGEPVAGLTAVVVPEDGEERQQ